MQSLGAAPSSSRDDIRARIIDVAARLLQERGAGALTTRGVAEAAEVQAPTIYRLFSDKDGLIDAVAEHVMATYVAAKATVDDDSDPVDALRSSWRMHIDFGLANPQLYGLLSGPRHGRHSPSVLAGIEVLRGRVHRLAAAGVLRVSERRALDLIHAAGTGTVLALLETQPEDRDPGLADAMLDAVFGSILDRAAAAPGHSAVSADAIAVAFAAHIPDLPDLTDAERALLAEWMTRSIASAEKDARGQ